MIDQKAARARLDQLRVLWINSHDGISPEMLAGLEWPPEDWLNANLMKQGERWRARVRGPNVEAYLPEDAERP